MTPALWVAVWLGILAATGLVVAVVAAACEVGRPEDEPQSRAWRALAAFYDEARS